MRRRKRADGVGRRIVSFELMSGKNVQRAEGVGAGRGVKVREGWSER